MIEQDNTSSSTEDSVSLAKRSAPLKKVLIVSVVVLIVAVGVVTAFPSLRNFLSLRAVGPSATAAPEVATKPTPSPNPSLAAQTNRLLGLIRAYTAASDQAKQQALSELVTQAQSRKEAFVTAMRENPEEAVRAALPSSVYESLPPQAQELVEQEITLEGEYSLAITDYFNDKRSDSTHRIQLDDTSEIQLFPTHPENMPAPAQRVRMTAYQVDEAAVIDTGSEGSVQTLGSTVTADATAAPRKTLVLLFNFQNNASQPFSTDTALNNVFGPTQSLKNYYDEIAFGKIAFTGNVNPTGDVTDWLTIPYDSTNCSSNYPTWGSAAKTAAQNAGWDLNAYDHIIHVFPASDCSWGGVAYVGGRDSFIPAQYFNYSYPYRTYVVSHEIGHNLGSRHANSYNCTQDGQRATIGDSCTTDPYGDIFDIMGTTSSWTPYHMSGFHKGQVGFLGSANTLEVTSSGTYSIAPLEQSSAGVQSLRIPRDASNYFYVDFRQPFGYDSYSSGSPAVNGVMLRYGRDYPVRVESQLLDANPVSTSFSDAPLAVGKTFTDPLTGITITTQSISPTGATVDISFNCVQVDPTVTLSPTAQWGTAGQSLNYDLTIKNNDGVGCPSSSFSIASSLPSGWSQTGATETAVLTPGASTTETITIASDSAATEGLYEFTETVTNTSVTSATASVTGNYNVTPPDTTGPSVTITEPADGTTLSGNRTKISVDASDTSGVASITIAVNGDVINTCADTTTCNTNWSTRGLAAGDYVITATAQDTSTPTPNTGSTSVTVTIGSGGSGGGGTKGGGNGGNSGTKGGGPKNK